MGIALLRFLQPSKYRNIVRDAKHTDALALVSIENHVITRLADSLAVPFLLLAAFFDLQPLFFSTWPLSYSFLVGVAHQEPAVVAA